MAAARTRPLNQTRPPVPAPDRRQPGQRCGASRTARGSSPTPQPRRFTTKSTMRILLVEDELQIADFIARGLSENGYGVDVCHDGEEAIHWPAVADFDIIILDVMLPVRDGIEVCRVLRESGVRTPILMLTARDTVEDRVRGLDSGADDYLVKPFAFAELLARLRALTRRQPCVLGAVLQTGHLVIDN